MLLLLLPGILSMLPVCLALHLELPGHPVLSQHIVKPK